MKIKVNYKTGNSFGSSDEVDYIELAWKNLDRAKESLKRIKNHWEFYKDNAFIYKKPKGKLPVGVTWNDEYRLLMLELITDDGKAYPYSPFWCGYFETLHKAEIVEADNDLVYKPDGF